MWIRRQDGALINTDALNMIYVDVRRDYEDNNFPKFCVCGDFKESENRREGVIIASLDDEGDAHEVVFEIFSDIARGERTLNIGYLLKILDERNK